MNDNDRNTDLAETAEAALHMLATVGRLHRELAAERVLNAKLTRSLRSRGIKVPA